MNHKPILFPRILVTGSEGFIGKNLIHTLKQIKEVKVLSLSRKESLQTIPELIKKSDVVVHLAGENRPLNEEDFKLGNTDLTSLICDSIVSEFVSIGRKVPIIFASSTQATLDNPYGRSKLDAEDIIKDMSTKYKIYSVIFRLPGVFGKWSKPNYNSVVATFCHNISRGIPIKINDPSKELKLCYIDDVVNQILRSLQIKKDKACFNKIEKSFSIKLSLLAKVLESFHKKRKKLEILDFSSDLMKNLYSTYVSYLPENEFSYDIPKYLDDRGVFVECFKSLNIGQISFFSSMPGVVRGGHYHHSKVERFIIIKGSALFRFENIDTKEIVEINTTSEHLKVVETIPGWSHEIVNIGSDELLAIVWANEIFDRDNPDTYIYG